jgi:hypothetical protein
LTRHLLWLTLSRRQHRALLYRTDCQCIELVFLLQYAAKLECVSCEIRRDFPVTFEVDPVVDTVLLERRVITGLTGPSEVLPTFKFLS